MKKAFYIILIISAGLSIQTTFGQYYYYDSKFLDKDVVWEVGGSVGGMNCVTDLGKRSFTTKNTNTAAGLYGGFLYHNFIGARLELTWGNVEAADSNANKGSKAYDRNLSFRSNITEVSLLAEFHPLMMRYRDEMPKLSGYMLAGVGWFSYNPQAYLNGKWINLQPLSLEGQGFTEYKSTREKYNLSQVNVPIGFGGKYEISQYINVRAEFLYRFLFTDYLDDASMQFIDPALFDTNLSAFNASLAKALHARGAERDPNYAPGSQQRGGIKTKDSFWTINLKLGVNLGRNRYH